MHNMLAGSASTLRSTQDSTATHQCHLIPKTPLTLVGAGP